MSARLTKNHAITQAIVSDPRFTLRQSDVTALINERFPHTTNVILFLNCAVAKKDKGKPKIYDKAVTALSTTHYAIEHANEADTCKASSIPGFSAKEATAKTFTKPTSGNSYAGHLLTRADPHELIGMERAAAGGAGRQGRGMGLMRSPEAAARDSAAAKERANAEAAAVAAKTCTNLRIPDFILPNVCNFKYFLVAIHGELPSDDEKPLFVVPLNTIIIQTGAGVSLGHESNSGLDVDIVINYFLNETNLQTMFRNFLGIHEWDPDLFLRNLAYNVENEPSVDKIISLTTAEASKDYWGVYEITNDDCSTFNSYYGLNESGGEGGGGSAMGMGSGGEGGGGSAMGMGSGGAMGMGSGGAMGMGSGYAMGMGSGYAMGMGSGYAMGMGSGDEEENGMGLGGGGRGGGGRRRNDNNLKGGGRRKKSRRHKQSRKSKTRKYKI